MKFIAETSLENKDDCKKKLDLKVLFNNIFD